MHGCILVLFCRFACTLISTSCLFPLVCHCYLRCVNYCVTSCFTLLRLFDRALLVRCIFWFYCLYSDCHPAHEMRLSGLPLGPKAFSRSLTAVNTQKKGRASGVFCCCNFVRDMYWFPPGVFCCDCCNSNFSTSFKKKYLTHGSLLHLVSLFIVLFILDLFFSFHCCCI